MTFHEPLTPFADRLFKAMGYEFMLINDQHIIVTNSKHRKVDIYRDNKKSWFIIGSGMSIYASNHVDMAATVIKNLEEI